MKFLLSLISIGVFASIGYGQLSTASQDPNCDQGSIKNISSRGVKLGMALDETLALFAENGSLSTAFPQYNEQNGTFKVTINEYPMAQAIVNLTNDAKGQFGHSAITLVPKDKVRFDGISRYSLGFLDSKLAYFSVFYLKPKWESDDQFSKTMAATLQIPTLHPTRRVKCGEYSVELRFSYQDEAKSSMWVSTNIDKELTERRKRKETEERDKDIKIFKP